MKTNKINNKTTGYKGEAVAEYYLKTKKHQILGKNVRLKRGEIDILSFKNNTIYITEVKTLRYKNQKDFLSPENVLVPEDNFSPRKVLKLKALSEELYLSYPKKAVFKDNLVLRDGLNPDLNIQIDGIAVKLLYDKTQLKKIRVRHFPNL